MLECKLCGTANSQDSSVCVKCGASLIEKKVRKQNGVKKKRENKAVKEIFSDTRSEELAKDNDKPRDIFSSGEKYEKAKRGEVLGKIYEQELALGEVPDNPSFDEPEEVKPIIIDREITSDIVSGSKKRYKKNKSKSGSYKIPQRVIEPSQVQTNKQKNNGNDKKVELKPSENVQNSQKKHNGGKPNKNKKPNGENISEKTTAKQAEFHGNKNGTPKQKNKQNSDRKKSSNTTYEELVPETQSVKPNNNKKKRPQAENGRRQLNEEKLTNIQAFAENKQEHSINKQNSASYSNGEKPVKNKKHLDVHKDSTDNSSKTENSVVSEEQSDNDSVKNPDKSKVNSAVTTAVAVSAERASKSPKTDKSDKPVKSPENGSAENPEKVQKSANPKQKKPRFTEEDIESNKNIAAFAYLGILFLLPFSRRKNSVFCKTHTRQGIAVFVYSLIVEIVTLAVVLGLRVLLVWNLKLPYMLFTALMLVIASIMLVLVFIPSFYGAAAAFGGSYKPVPIVGRFVKNGKKKKKSKTKKSENKSE